LANCPGGEQRDLVDHQPKSIVNTMLAASDLL
jgi:hypothetical protein